MTYICIVKSYSPSLCDAFCYLCFLALLRTVPRAAAARERSRDRRPPARLPRPRVFLPAIAPSSLSPDERSATTCACTTGTASTSPTPSSLVRGRYGADGRGLCPLDCAYLRPSDRRRADGLAHAPRFGFASHARLLHDAGRAGYPRPQFAAAQRRILHSRASRRVLASPVVTTSTSASAPPYDLQYGHAEPASASAANDFRYTLASGATGTLYGVQAEYVLLFINNPGCPMCKTAARGRSAVRRCSPR